MIDPGTLVIHHGLTTPYVSDILRIDSEGIEGWAFWEMPNDPSIVISVIKGTSGRNKLPRTAVYVLMSKNIGWYLGPVGELKTLELSQKTVRAV